jgi:hypothetical protein
LINLERLQPDGVTAGLTHGSDFVGTKVYCRVKVGNAACFHGRDRAALSTHQFQHYG